MTKCTFTAVFGIVICLFIVLAGCVSSSPSKENAGKTAAKSAPDWFFNPPKDDAKNKYFIGSGSSETGDISAAEDNAIRDLMDQIIMYIGVQVTSDTTSTAVASLDDFESDIRQTVKVKGSARVTGFEIKEKLPHEKDGKLTMYILAAYNKIELEKERERIRKIFEEQYEAISGPEAEGERLAGSGKYYEAAIKFMEAAGAAASSKVENAEIKFERNINKAKSAVEKINLIKLNDNITGLAGQSLPEPFMLKVTSGASEDSPGIPDVVLDVGYTEINNAGKTRYKSQKMKTDENGICSFEHPIPDFVGAADVKMSLDFDSYMEPLWDTPSEFSEMVDGLDSLIISKKATFAFAVESNAKNIDTGIVILDIDVDAEAVKKTETASSLLGTLTDERFKIRLLNLNPGDLKDKSDYDIIAILSNKYASQVKRAVFGTARVLSFSEKSGKTFAKCSATIQVVDLESGEILLTVVKTVNAMGSDEKTAQSDGFRRLGEEIGKEIKNKLR
ncbi:MAG: hypothetical protein JW881_19740 [Spirochaetales bacterium]|nr:hypothetical protein [Spirochaetales bacterium]